MPRGRTRRSCRGERVRAFSQGSSRGERVRAFSAGSSRAERIKNFEHRIQLDRTTVRQCSRESAKPPESSETWPEMSSPSAERMRDFKTERINDFERRIHLNRKIVRERSRESRKRPESPERWPQRSPFHVVENVTQMQQETQPWLTNLGAHTQAHPQYGYCWAWAPPNPYQFAQGHSSGGSGIVAGPSSAHGHSGGGSGTVKGRFSARNKKKTERKERAARAKGQQTRAEIRATIFQGA